MKKMEGTIVFLAVIAIVGMIGLFLWKSFGVIQPNQKGLKVTLGTPAEEESAGWYFALWPFQRMVKITKEMMIFIFTVPSAVTRSGKVEGHDKVVEPAEINIKCAIYAQFDEDKLTEIVQHSPGYDAKTLGPYLVPFAIDTVRAMAGRLPWRLINKERFKSAVWVQARLVGGKYFGIDDDDVKKPIKFKGPSADGKTPESEICPDEVLGKSPFVTLPMRNVSFVIEDLIFGTDMRASITAAERANLDADAKVIAAEAEKTKKIKEGQGDAEARGAMLAKIKENPDMESLAALREIGKGPSNFIFALPEGIQKLLSKIGG